MAWDFSFNDEFKGIRVKLSVKDYEIMQRISSDTGFSIDFLVRSAVHDAVVGFTEIHPEFKMEV